MRTITLIVLLLSTSFFAAAESVKLKITYKGDGLADHTVTVMLGNAALGSGVTDSDGEVTISVSSLPSKNIDLKGEKVCDGARKSWSASGYVTLDGSNYAHLKMEDLVAEMVDASGGMMSEGMLVASYGLVCSGSSSDSGGSIASKSTGETSEESGGSTTTETPTMTKEEMQAQQKQGLENKIASIENKIERKQSKIDSGKYTDEKKDDAEQDIRELELEKQITQNKLDKLNMQMQKGMLNKSERKAFKEKEDALKDELKAVKQEGKSGESATSEESEEVEGGEVEEAGSEYVITEAQLADMSNNDLKKRKIGLKKDLGQKNLKLKTRKNALSPNELKELEQEIADIEKSIEVIEAELENR